MVSDLRLQPSAGSKISGWHTFKHSITALAVFGPTAFATCTNNYGNYGISHSHQEMAVRIRSVHGKISPNFTIKKMDLFETFTVHRFVSLWSPSRTKVWRWVPASLKCLLRFSTWNCRVPKEMSKGKILWLNRISWWFHGDFMVISWWFHGDLTETNWVNGPACEDKVETQRKNVQGAPVSPAGSGLRYI